MLIDRSSPVHLYIQIADSIRRQVSSGEFAGGALPSEAELCRLYCVSRYPMRQAMALLVKEGVVRRSRGKGTFAAGGAHDIAATCPPARSRAIALVIPGLGSDFTVDILKGFEQAVSSEGYTAVIALSGNSLSEAECIERVAAGGAAGIVIFPMDDSPIDEAFLNGLLSKGIYVSIIDRNPGLDHIDYIGSDNSGGGYLAARHMSLNGYNSAVFVLKSIWVSSVRERFSGFCRGLQQFGMRLINETADAEEGSPGSDAYSLDSFAEQLEGYRGHLPFAVFAENDAIAEQAQKILQEHGYAVGTDVGIVGFDNLTKDEYFQPKLTSVAQNGVLMGDAAGKLAVQKIQSSSKQSVRHILPTQLIARQSCGEGRA